MRNGRSGAEGSRTLDLLNAIQALSQLSYGPTRRDYAAGAWRIPRDPRTVKHDDQSHFWKRSEQRPVGGASSPQGMRAEEIQHVLRPERRPAPVVLAAQRVAEWIVREIHVRVRIGATGIEAGSDALLRRVDDHIGETDPEGLQLAPKQLAVRTDARDVAVVVDVVGRQPAVEETHLSAAARRSEDGNLRAGIVERAERVRCGVDRESRDLWPVERVEKPHRGPVGPSGHVDPPRVDLAGGHF